MLTDVQKKNYPFHVTILSQVIIGILDLWNASTYLSIPQKICRKAVIRPIVPIDL